MLFLSKKVVICLFLSLLSPLFVYAGTETDPKSLNHESYQLGEIVVTGSKPVAEKVETISRITAKEIAARGARNLNEALELVPGLHVRIGGAGTPRIDMRGFRTRHVTLLLNGVPFNDTYDAQFDPTTIPVEHIAEIKVISGGGSLLYGPGGNGGIINIVTKKGKKGTHGSLSAEIGEDEARLGRGTVSHATDRFDVFVSGSAQSRDGYDLSNDFTATSEEDGDRRENSDFQRRNLFASTNLYRGAQTQIGLTVNLNDGKNGVPTVVNYNRNDPFSKKPKYDRVDDLSALSGQIAVDHKFSSRLGLRGWAYANRQDLLENRYDGEDYETQEDNGAYSIDSTSDIYGINLQLLFDVAAFGKITLGAMGESQSWEATGFEVGRRGRSELDLDYENERYSVVCEYEWQPVDNAGFTLGYGHHFLKKDAGKDDDAADYRIGAYYDLLKDTRLKASFGKNVRFPSIRQLYDPSAGNTDLTAEETRHYEMGICQQLLGGATLELNAFKTEAEDFIEKIDDDPYMNYEKYNFWGIEFTASVRPVDNLYIRIGYSYLNSEDDSPNTDRDELQYRPENKYTAAITYAFSCGLKAHADLLHVTDQYFYDSDKDPPLEKAALNDYTLVNIKLSQQFFRESLMACIGAYNLFDEDYEQSYGLPQPGRYVYGGVEISF